MIVLYLNLSNLKIDKDKTKTIFIIRKILNRRRKKTFSDANIIFAIKSKIITSRYTSYLLQFIKDKFTEKLID